jgi:hypothetical protein
VATLPTTDIKSNVIYLKWPIGTWADKYEEWIYYSNTWTKIWETSVDLSPYLNLNTQTSDVITEWSTKLFLTVGERTKLWNTSWTNTWDETTASIKTKLWAATSNADWYLKKEDFATFNWKQNALNTQTEYTNKGSAKKVAQISTNSLWQVTNVTEVNIALNADDISDSSTTNKFVTQADKDSWDGKQDELESWVNIRTINWTSILWSWNIDTPTGIPSQTWEAGKFLTTDGTTASWANVPWIQLASNSPITVSKLWVGTEAQYQALATKSNDTIYMTV